MPLEFACFQGAEEAAEKNLLLGRTPEKHTSGPKGPVDSTGVIVRAEALTY
jgi:hypothetical protein